LEKKLSTNLFPEKEVWTEGEEPIPVCSSAFIGLANIEGGPEG